ncbi:F-box and associated interaction domains-containing protein [Striga asiatica]|uniref:F-box and associated interaction domains-containing protein n=1 Tax=Striga asiatica TaxID=4170 RepID=A0A5A7P8F7_STRAF|nr:F-box and associated interaction domains-containing protein [Striga asiatica]
MDLSNIHHKNAPTHQNHDPTADIEWIGHLPGDAITEILSRLPAKNLCKFRCVSKSWLDLLTRDKEFITRHMKRSKEKPMSLFRRYDFKSQVIIEMTLKDVQGNTVDKFMEKIDVMVDSFLTCGPLSVFCGMCSLYICNPSMHRVVRVPSAPKARFQNVGFGYLPKKSEYKIVNLFYSSLDENHKLKCEVFSFKNGENVQSGSWRTIKRCPFKTWIDGYPVCANGIMYWTILSCENKSILCLNLENEEFSDICYPVHGDKKYSFLECVGLMGDLRVVGFSAEEPNMIDIWALKDKEKKVWGIECRVDLFPLCPKFLIPICDGESEEILVHISEKDLVCYNVRSGIWWRVDYYKGMKTYSKPCLYYDSLVPL